MHLIFLYPYKAGQKEDIDTSARDPTLFLQRTTGSMYYARHNPYARKAHIIKKMCTRIAHTSFIIFFSSKPL